MPTWGQPSRSSRTSRSTPPRSQPAPSSGRAKTAATKQVDPPRPDAREPRRELGGRELEFAGIACVAVGVLLALAVYFGVAGPVGRGIAALLGWVVGIGRYLVPVALVGVGAALIHKGRSANPARLVVGWVVVSAAVLGLIHVASVPASGPDRFDDLSDAGGVIGLVLGEPLRALIADAGAVVVLVAVFVLGMLLITGASLKTAVTNTGKGAAAVAKPLGRKARQVIGDLGTLKSEREPSGEIAQPPSLYDAAAEGDFPDPAPKPKRSRSSRAGGDDLPAGPGEQAELELGPGAQAGKWVLPPAAFLTRSTQTAINQDEVNQRGRVLVDSLNSHGVETKLLGQTVGPTVTRFELELAPGVKVARVTSLNRDIAYAMAATDVRILAPIPGRSAIGVEVPNHTRQLVSLGDVMGAPEAKAATHPLDVAIGKDIAGRSVFLNLANTPHLLIAGTTGAGKSSGINSILTSLLMRCTPEQVRLILIDPKQVEMGQYNRLPHLLTQPVVNPKKAANALAWAVKEMERRYDLLFEVGFRDITGYNAAYDRGEMVAEEGSDKEFERLPYIVVVVDELNDLMMVAARDVEESITRIAQKARAVGVHLIVATQRPSVNVITGVIKANIPARIAYAVNSLTDSRVILDQPGAEKLVGKGDMLLLPGNSNVSQRIQGCFVAEEEVRKVVAHWRRQAPEVTYVSGVEGDEHDPLGGGGVFGSSGGDDDEDETLLRQAMELVVRSQLGSTSMLQRKLKVGFARAGRLMDLLEQRGVVGPSEGSKARAVLMTVEEFELLQDAQR
jgi:DNA segregation ATPase FtsK/SpoIIIE, S-DNA-T family